MRPERVIRVLGFIGCALAATACSTTNTRPEGDGGIFLDGAMATDTSMTDGATTDTSLPDAFVGTVDAGTACLVRPTDPGPTVGVTQVASASPAPLGGAFVEGTYHLTAIDVFTGSGGQTGLTGETMARKCFVTATSYACMELDGDTTLDAAASAPHVFGESVATAGTIVTLSDLCPVGPARKRGYSASNTQIQLFLNLGNETIRDTLVRE